MAKGGIEPPDTWIFSPLLCGEPSYLAVANVDIASAARDLPEDHRCADGIARRIRAASRIKFGFRIISVGLVC